MMAVGADHRSIFWRGGSPSLPQGDAHRALIRPAAHGFAGARSDGPVKNIPLSPSLYRLIKRESRLLPAALRRKKSASIFSHPPLFTSSSPVKKKTKTRSGLSHCSGDRAVIASLQRHRVTLLTGRSAACLDETGSHLACGSQGGGRQQTPPPELYQSTQGTS